LAGRSCGASYCRVHGSCTCEHPATRWAAIGAAIAVVLGAGGIGVVNATISSGERNVLVPITACRLTDTRSTAVDARNTPLQPGETYALSAHGSNGDCTIPNDATALELNVTATEATLATFFTIWGGGSQPIASSLNPAPGQPPTPNAVTTDLSGSGMFNIFNFTGTVNVIVDITGYYADHNHDDRYYTQSQIDQRTPKTQIITVGGAAFTPRFSSLEYVKGFSTGGAYINGGSGTTPALIAELQLPDGGEITSVRVGYLDAAFFEDLSFSLSCERVDKGFFVTVANFTSAGTNDWLASEMTIEPAERFVDNESCSYQFLARNNNWVTIKDLLKVKSVVVEVELPG